jgi:hypothetical protein
MASLGHRRLLRRGFWLDPRGRHPIYSLLVVIEPYALPLALRAPW